MEKRKNGRPSLYKPEYAETARKLCLLGMTDSQLAIFFEVSEQTINNWKKRHGEFAEALTQGKAIADADVAVALFRRAIGYTTTEQKIIATPDGPKVFELKKTLPPEVGAARFWLKNRQPQHWRENVDIPADPNQFPGPSEEELDEIYEESMEKSRKRVEEMALTSRGTRLGIATDTVGETAD